MLAHFPTKENSIMADDQLERMKVRYGSVLAEVQRQQVRLSHVHIQDGKLFIQGEAPSEEAKNRVWDEIKRVNPNWQQELTADLTVDTSARTMGAGASSVGTQTERTYTVKAGDSLSKISKDLYGNAAEYMKIFEANRDVLKDPNKIQPGQTLRIPG